MNTAKLIDMMRMGNITIPLFLIRNYSKLGIDSDCLIIVAYLLNREKTCDYKKIGNDLCIDDRKVLQCVNQLQENGLLSFCVEKDCNGIMEESMSLDPLYNKLSLIMMEDLNEEQSSGSNIYEKFEEEFGRTLSPIEYEIITGWFESNYAEEVIIEALKEAVYNGASNLRYIDRILFEWNKKGIKKADDVRRDREKFVNSKKAKIEVPDYNWLEDDEEEK